MQITIFNQALRLTVDTLGAQMMRLADAGGCEYLWQGDPKYWADRAPTLFPFIGRLTGNSYKLCGKVYPMGIHGFAAASEFSVAEQSESCLVLTLDGSANYDSYPFDFVLTITYRLAGSRLEITYAVRNNGNSTMPFGIGGHPGFRVPLNTGEAFEDYYLEFSQCCQPDRVGFSPTVYLSGHDEAYPLEDRKRIRLQHSLFDDDAIILKNMAREVALCSQKTGKRLTVTYPQMPYLGIWHWPKTDAPYVCIEPWTSLPSRQDVVEEFTCKSDLIHLPPKASYENTWSITIGEETK